jgi:hydroxymethylbilane synthase
MGATARVRSARSPLRLATRGSPLARRQAEIVAAAFARVDPERPVEPVVVRTKGDELADAPLDRIGGQGIFVTEVQRAVLEGRADVAVHSAKDLPAAPGGDPALVLASVPERADVRDVLVGSRLRDLAPGAVIATGATRRRAQLAHLRPDLGFVELRGNIGTRLARAGDGGVAAVVVAAAALDRLGWGARGSDWLSPSVMLPQVGQGSIALECRVDDERSRALAAAIDDPEAHRQLLAERALLAGLAGNCSVPVAGWAESVSGVLRLHGMVASGDGPAPPPARSRWPPSR